MRKVLIVGASACCVIGGYRVCESIVYHANFDPYILIFCLTPFVPIILLAPNSVTPKKRGLFVFIGILETVIIVLNYFIVLR